MTNLVGRAFDAAARKLRGAAAHGGRSGPTAARFRLNFPTEEEEKNMQLGLTLNLTGNGHSTKICFFLKKKGFSNF